MSKKLLLILFTLSSSLLAFSQGTWTPRDTLPDSAMAQGISGFSIGNYGYVGLGDTYYAGDDFHGLYQFNPSNDSWTKKAEFPGRARVAPASFVIGNSAYLVCGSVHNGGACVTECWEYNATNDTWTQKANFPGAARTYVTGFAIDSLGYVGLGAYELTDFRKDFYAYHPSTNTWKQIADFGSIARSGAIGFGVNGKGYVCFGEDSTQKSYNDMWQYDPVLNTWTKKTSNPYTWFAPNGFAICDNIYVGIGDTTDGIDGFREFWKYNTLSDSWTQQANIPGAKSTQGAAFSIGDTGYSGFGWDTVEILINACYEFYGGDSCTVANGFIDHSKFTDVSIYPNPFDKECSIILPDGFDRTPQFELLSIDGIRQKVDIGRTNLTYSLKRNSLPSGIYILSITYEGIVFYKKLTIAN